MPTAKEGLGQLPCLNPSVCLDLGCGPGQQREHCARSQEPSCIFVPWLLSSCTNEGLRREVNIRGLGASMCVTQWFPELSHPLTFLSDSLWPLGSYIFYS